MNTVRSFPARQHPHPLHHSKAREAPILRLHFSDSDGVHHRACLTSTLRIDPAELPAQLQDDILLRLRGLLRLMDLDLQGVQHISSLSMEMRSDVAPEASCCCCGQGGEASNAPA